MKTQLANRNMEQLVVKSVVKRFGEHTVLQAFDLSVAKGEFVALLGPSGCGKSTLLRIIAGLETPNGGDVLIAGRNVTELAPEDRNIALMFQSYALLPHMTVLENVRFPLRMRSNLSRAEQEKRSMEALALVKLDPFSSRYPRQLSGGQQQRVALARSIVAEPDLLLLDEPLSNLDARLREDMQIELKRLHEELGLTTIFVTHDQDEALGLADTVILMNGGRIEQQGTPEEIYRRPRTEFAAGFLGGSNILDLEVFMDKRKPMARFANGAIVALSATEALAPGQHKFMLRKEAISFDPDAAMVSVDGSVETLNYLGSQTRSLVSAGGLQLVAMTDPASARPQKAKLRIGWRPEDLIPLDTE